MSARTTTVLFLGSLIAAFFVVDVVTIYGFGYFEGALGGPTFNLLLNAPLYATTALVIAVGFAAVLFFRKATKSFRGWHVIIAAVSACALIRALALVGPLLDAFGSMELRLAAIGLYSFVIGAVVAAALMFLSRGGEYAA